MYDSKLGKARMRDPDQRVYGQVLPISRDSGKASAETGVIDYGPMRDQDRARMPGSEGFACYEVAPNSQREK